jgi:hypothetical protein
MGKTIISHHAKLTPNAIQILLGLYNQQQFSHHSYISK